MEERGDAAIRSLGLTMESDRATSIWQGQRSRKNNRRQSIVFECCAIDCKDRCFSAKPARTIRAVEHELQAILPILLMVQTRGLGTSTRSTWSRWEFIEVRARFDDCLSVPTFVGSKRGQDTQDFGSSDGGFSGRFHAAFNDEGDPVRLHLTEEEYHDLTFAEVLLEDLEPKHVIADKECGNDPLHQKIRSAGTSWS